MLTDIWIKSLWDQRRVLLGWGLGLMAVALVYTGFYPLAVTPEYAQLVNALPPGLAEAMGWDDIASPEGYLGSTVFGILGPILTIIFAISSGARAIAGDEENGHLELLIAHPVSRTRVVLQRSIALWISLLMAATVVLLAILAIRDAIDLEVSTGGLVAASLNLALLAGVFGTLAIMVAAIRGRRGVVIGVTSVAAVLAYLADGLASQIVGMQWLQEFSPFHWFAGTETLRTGIDPARSLTLFAVSSAFVAIAVVAFNRRDVAV